MSVPFIVHLVIVILLMMGLEAIALFLLSTGYRRWSPMFSVPAEGCQLPWD